MRVVAVVHKMCERLITVLRQRPSILFVFKIFLLFIMKRYH